MKFFMFQMSNINWVTIMFFTLMYMFVFSKKIQKSSKFKSSKNVNKKKQLW